MILLVEIAFYKSDKTLLDKGIRFFSKSPYSHCEIIIDRLHSISASGRDGGVRIKKYEDMNFNDTNKWDIYKLKVNNIKSDELVKFVEEYKYKYDFISIILYHMLRIPINIKKKYICSEYCYMIILKHLQGNDFYNVCNSLRSFFGNKEYKINPSNLLLILEMNKLLSR